MPKKQDIRIFAFRHSFLTLEFAQFFIKNFVQRTFPFQQI